MIEQSSARRAAHLRALHLSAVIQSDPQEIDVLHDLLDTTPQGWTEVVLALRSAQLLHAQRFSPDVYPTLLDEVEARARELDRPAFIAMAVLHRAYDAAESGDRRTFLDVMAEANQQLARSDDLPLDRACALVNLGVAYDLAGLWSLGVKAYTGAAELLTLVPEAVGVALVVSHNLAESLMMTRIALHEAARHDEADRLLIDHAERLEAALADDRPETWHAIIRALHLLGDAIAGREVDLDDAGGLREALQVGEPDIALALGVLLGIDEPGPADADDRFSTTRQALHARALRREGASADRQIDAHRAHAVSLARRNWNARDAVTEAITMSVTANVREAERQQLETEVITDPLTDLGNRRAADQAIETLDGVQGTALVIDVDRFKAINDREGHAVGDEVLKAVASALTDAIPWGGAVIARQGGDEFLALIPERARPAPEDLPEQVARKITLYASAATTTTVTATVGIAHGPISAGLVRAADADLYERRERIRIR